MLCAPSTYRTLLSSKPQSPYPAKLKRKASSVACDVLSDPTIRTRTDFLRQHLTCHTLMYTKRLCCVCLNQMPFTVLTVKRSVHLLHPCPNSCFSCALQALETRKALNGAAPNSPQSTAAQLYAVINVQSSVVKSQVGFRVDNLHP